MDKAQAIKFLEEQAKDAQKYMDDHLTDIRTDPADLAEMMNYWQGERDVYKLAIEALKKE